MYATLVFNRSTVAAQTAGPINALILVVTLLLITIWNTCKTVGRCPRIITEHCYVR